MNCHYSLAGLTEHRCPECGLVFDPMDSSTYDAVDSPKAIRRRIVIVVVVLIVAVVILYLLEPYFP